MLPKPQVTLHHPKRFATHCRILPTTLSEKRLATEADLARCCYHEIVDDPKDDDKKAFYLRQTQEVYYVVADQALKREGGKPPIATQGVAGSLIPPEHWNTDWTKLLWIVKWQQRKGLQPARPQVMWTGPDTTIPAGKALKLSP